MITAAAPPLPTGPRSWWETRAFVVAMVLLAFVPLVYPPIPPLVDLPGHMGRYRVELDLASSALLQRYYTYHWTLIGNLGVDLLIIPMAKLFGLELGTKLIVICIPPLTVAGFLWVAREVHHRIPPTALFALPFAFGHPFLFGFVNFSLSMAFAFLAFGLWLRLGRLGRLRLRLALFVPISLIVFLTHTFGWGVLGLLCFSAEAVRQHDQGKQWWRAGFHAALPSLSMALPLLIIILWRHDAAGGITADYLNWRAKLLFIDTALRDRWKNFDEFSIFVCGVVVILTLRINALGFSRNLGFSAFVLLGIYILLPRVIFGSNYADMRLVPFIIAVILLGIRFRGETPIRPARWLAALGFAFFLARLVGTTASFAIAANDQLAQLEALNYVPRGARVASLVGAPCSDDWAQFRNSHLGAMVIVRRDGFSNDQWRMDGAQLLSVKNVEGWGWFGTDPSQLVNSDGCGTWEHWSIDHSLTALPREKFDFLWLIDPPQHDPRHVTGLTPVWRHAGSILYRIR